MKQALLLALSPLALAATAAAQGPAGPAGPAGPTGPAYPAGYSTPGHSLTHVIDVSSYTGTQHPVVYGLTDPSIGLPSLSGLGAGSKVGVFLPSGTFSGFTLNDSVWYQPGVDLDALNVGDIEINLVAPYRPKGQTKATIIEPSAFITGQRETVSVNAGSSWKGRLRCWSMAFHASGRKTIGAGSPVTNPANAYDAGTYLRFDQCDFLRSPASPAGFSPYWMIHTYLTSPFLTDCIIDIPGMQEHAVYPHNQSSFTSGMRNCDVLHIGGQIWQETCRNGWVPELGSCNKYEGPYLGRGTTVLDGVVSHSGFHKTAVGPGGGSGSALTFQSTGRDIVIKNCILSDLDPNDTLGAPGITFGAVVVTVGGQINSSSGCSASWDSEPKILGSDGRMYHNGSLTVNRNVFAWKDSLRELVSFSSVADTTSVTINGFFNNNNRPLRLAENGLNSFPQNTNAYYSGTGDLYDCKWNYNNLPGIVSYAGAVIPGFLGEPGLSVSNPTVQEGASSTAIGVTTSVFDQTMVN